jgi:hypothetical protein
MKVPWHYESLQGTTHASQRDHYVIPSDIVLCICSKADSFWV